MPLEVRFPKKVFNSNAKRSYFLVPKTIFFKQNYFQALTADGKSVGRRSVQKVM